MRYEITVDFAREVLADACLGRRGRTVTFDGIASAVCEHFSLRPSDLRSQRRSRHVAVPRQVAMYLCRRLLNASFPHIGELFGRDHSTVIHARRRRSSGASRTTRRSRPPSSSSSDSITRTQQ